MNGALAQFENLRKTGSENIRRARLSRNTESEDWSIGVLEYWSTGFKWIPPPLQSPLGRRGLRRFERMNGLLSINSGLSRSKGTIKTPASGKQGPDGRAT
jgi:hypothetical protein